ncbi:hypothetical protein PQX77_016710 [Marasmius sp. AFHP31]|nr:hypothetical protein PQX77_016710 [Marasmius sp. AFHP31]
MVDSWWKTPPWLRHLSMFYTTLDRNCKTCHFQKKGDYRDRSLYKGQSYYNNNNIYNAFLKKAGKKKLAEPVPDCDINHQCSHVFIMGVTDMYGSENQANVDAAFSRGYWLYGYNDEKINKSTTHRKEVPHKQMYNAECAYAMNQAGAGHCHNIHIVHIDDHNCKKLANLAYLIASLGFTKPRSPHGHSRIWFCGRNPDIPGSWLDVYHHPEKELAPSVAAVLESITHQEGGGISLALPNVGLDLNIYWERAFEAEEIREKIGVLEAKSHLTETDAKTLNDLYTQLNIVLELFRQQQAIVTPRLPDRFSGSKSEEFVLALPSDMAPEERVMYRTSQLAIKESILHRSHAYDTINSLQSTCRKIEVLLLYRDQNASTNAMWTWMGTGLQGVLDWEGCPCKITTASKPCLNLVHAVDPTDQCHWHRNPETSNWRICELQPCPHADPLNSIPRTRQFPDGSELVPLPFPSLTPTPEPETNLTASTALPFAAPPTPVGSGPATPRPLSVLSHRSPSPAETTDLHASQTTTSTISSMSTQATANATLESLLSRLIDRQEAQQAQLDAIKDTFKANKDEGAVIAKPAVFKGDADDVAKFLPMFRNWATEQKAVRIKAGQGVTPEDVGKLDNKKTIQSALSFCEGGKAGHWAANYLKQANASTTNATIQFPFEGKWEVFEKQFEVRFGAANEKVDAIRELEHMKQGSKAVTVYSQDFRDAGAKTGLSDTDLMICFRSGLNPEVKKLLVTMDLAQGDPKDLDDLEDRSCRAERALEAEGFSARKRTETHTTTISATVPTHATQTNPDGGNSKTCEDFMRAMCNCCYGCGATDHTKAQGNHGQEQCHHCKHLKHCTSVCQDKFLGRMPGLGLRPARVARINSAVPFTLFPGETVNISVSPPAPTATIASMVPSTQVSASYTPSSDTVARIAALQDSLNQQNALIQQLMGQKDF